MAPSTVASASPHAIHNRADGASLIQVESNKLLPWLMLCCLLSGFAMAFAMFTFYQLTRTEREYKILSLQVQDQSAIMIREGLKRPEDFTNGPTYVPKRE